MFKVNYKDSNQNDAKVNKHNYVNNESSVQNDVQSSQIFTLTVSTISYHQNNGHYLNIRRYTSLGAQTMCPN